jgi:hypothetical protein
MAEAYQEAKQKHQSGAAGTKAKWPAEFRNRETGKVYTPHSEAERNFVYSDLPRNGLAKGGEGAGKSVSGIIKNLNRLRRGCNGIMVSPDFEHFKKSLWPEFRRWCPVDVLVEKDRYRLGLDWEARQPFELHFHSEPGNIATLYCGGIEDPASWEGPNVGFAHLDEARRKKNADALKVLSGRVRIPGPNGEPPQLYFTTTPRKNWLFDYFGPVKENDTRKEFKENSLVVTLFTEDNERAGNLEQGYTAMRGQSLTESEKRVLLYAEWEDIDDVERFLPNIILWDSCKEVLPPLTVHEPMVIAIDAATGRVGAVSDCFGLLGLTRHPNRPDDVAVRVIAKWQAKAGQQIDFDGTPDNPGPLTMITKLCADWNVVQVCYDPTELRYAATKLKDIVWTKEFSQSNLRAESDKQLLDLIIQRRIAHDGNEDLHEHIDNCDRRADPQDRKMRIVKREDGLKIDLAICLSMGSYEVLRLPL